MSGGLPSEVPAIAIPHSQPWLAEVAGAAVGCARDNVFGSWFGGRKVPTSGISSVGVQAEWRGCGVLARLLTDLLASAHARGAVISSLYPTAPAYYRRYGYEVIGSYDWLELSTSRLTVRPDPDLRVERVTAATWPDVEQCYAAWAAGHNGPLTRDADTRFGLPSGGTRTTKLAELGSVTIARDRSGAPRGFAVWNREDGYRAAGSLVVDDLCALDIAAYRTLAATLASHAAVAPMTRIASSGWGDAALGLASAPGVIVETTPYMLSILDVAGALTARGYADGVSERLTFRVTGLPVPGQDGAYELTVGAGTGMCHRAETTSVRVELDARGLALLYGGVPAARARWAGLLRGPGQSDATLDRVFGGLTFAVRDYF